MIRKKNEKQIEGIRKSCKLLARLYQELIPAVKEGASAAELDRLCKSFIKGHGGSPAWYKEDFPGAVCVSVNDEIIHGIPTKHKVFKAGDLVSLDIGIDLGGYISDSAVTVAVGEITPDEARLMEVTQKCLAAGIEACKAGGRIADISNAVYSLARENGFGVVYEYCGHGVGLDVHEEPSVPNFPARRGPNPRIVPGMVLAIEPMITLGTDDVEHLDDGWTVVTADGSKACHFEHTVAVFKDHTEILTAL